MIAYFPHLTHLDDRPVTEDQRKEASRLYHKPLLERLRIKTHNTIPAYLRHFSDSMSDLLVPTSNNREKNLIV